MSELCRSEVVICFPRANLGEFLNSLNAVAATKENTAERARIMNGAKRWEITDDCGREWIAFGWYAIWWKPQIPTIAAIENFLNGLPAEDVRWVELVGDEYAGVERYGANTPDEFGIYRPGDDPEDETPPEEDQVRFWWGGQMDGF